MRNYKFKINEKKMLADTVTPVGLYQQLRDKYPQSLLLESSDYHSKEESFTFICVEPVVTIKATKNRSQLFYKDELIEEREIKENFSEVYQDFAARVELDAPSEIKKINGFYGYMTFESVQYFETIKLKEATHESSIPDFNFSFYKFIIAINHFNDELLLIENIEENESSRIKEIECLLVPKLSVNFPFEIQDKETSNCTESEFKEMVARAKEHCKRGDVFQLVLSRQFKQAFWGDDFNVYRALRSINPSPYLFYFDYGQFRVIGSSPEAQIKVDEKQILINPIAGTFKRTGIPAEDILLAEKLKNDAKENAEHNMLVDLARNDISKHADKVSVSVFKEVQYFSHVIHLVSTVCGTDFKSNPLQIIGDTFPAGTLSGAPKYKAMELISQYENQPRGFYGGAVGFIGTEKNANLAIAIRSFVSKGNQLFYQAGAGIVVDSKEANELQEVNNKLAALKKAIQLASTL